MGSVKYRVIKQRLIQLKNGTAEFPGDEFDADRLAKWVDAVELAQRGYVEPITGDEVLTKEVADEAPVVKRGRQHKGSR